MCRQSRNNRYKKCYLKKPKLPTIPEEAGDGGVNTIKGKNQSINHNSSSNNNNSNTTTKSFSPKGIKRLLMSNTTSGNKSPRGQKKINKNKDFSAYSSQFDKGGNVTAKKPRQFSSNLYVITSNMGDASPRCRRLRKTEQNSSNFKPSQKDVIVNVTEENLSNASPGTVKKLIVANAGVGSQSPQCRRLSKDGSSNVKSKAVLKENISDIGCEKITKVIIVDSDAESLSSSSAKLNGSALSLNGNDKPSNSLKEKSMFKRVVKFLTVPPKKDFAAS